MRTFALLLLLLPALVSASEKTLLFVLFDGLAPTMTSVADTPNMDRLRDEGAWTHDMKPVFPTISGVNHTSYITGCVPGDHGMVSNYFYDPEKGLFEGGRDADWRIGCETIWEVAEREGKVAAVLGFIGNYSSSRGQTATHAPKEQNWTESPDDPVRTDQIIELLTMTGPDAPGVIAAYYKGPDWTGHWNGTSSEATQQAVRAADKEIGRLMQAVETSNKDVVLFVAADHSMVDVTTYFNIGRVMYKHDIEGRYASDGAHAFIYLDDPEQRDEVAQTLNQYEMVKAYPSTDYPEYFHPDSEGRSGDVLLVLDQPYWIADPHEFPDWARWLGLTYFWPVTIDLSAGIKATHGYPPDSTNMGTTFYAWGEAVNTLELQSFNIIDAAPTALDWLGLPTGSSASGKIRDEIFSRPPPSGSAH